MASRTAQSGTLTAGQAATVTITDAYPSVLVINRSGTGAIWVTLDGSTPTVAGANCYPVLGSRSFGIDPGSRPTVVKLISSAALDYTVEGGFQ